MKNTTITIGMDLGDKKHQICELDANGDILKQISVINTARSLTRYFQNKRAARVVIEAGTHSNWINDLLKGFGHEVLVGNPRKLRMIWSNDQKNDKADAQMLARIGRFDPSLLSPIEHRGQEARKDLSMIKSRDELVQTRSKLISHVRGTVKTFGGRVDSSSSACFHKKAKDQIPVSLAPALEPLLKIIEQLSAQIKAYEKQIDVLCESRYPETDKLRAVTGVGALTALAYVLTLEEPRRFGNSRVVGAYLGLTPRQDQSGQQDRQLPITKAGNSYLRRLLVGSAHYILGPFGPDCHLRNFGLKLHEKGGNNAKKRAIIAVARKLAVLLHHLWKSQQTYEPFYENNSQKAA